MRYVKCYQCGAMASAVIDGHGGGACLICASGYPTMYVVLPHVWGQKSTRIERAKKIIDAIKARI